MEIIGTMMASGGGGGGSASGGQGVGGIFSVITGFMGAHLKKREIQGQAAQARFDATDEFIAGQAQQASLLNELSATVGNQALAFAKGGVSLASHGVAKAREKVTKDAESELSAAFNNSERRRLAKIRQAGNLEQSAKNVMINQVFKSVGQAVSTGMDFAARGGPTDISRGRNPRGGKQVLAYGGTGSGTGYLY